MKPFFLYFILVTCTITAYNQNSVQIPDAKKVTVTNNPWNLDEYVWSHTHPRPGKDDKPVLDFDAIDKCRCTSLSEQVAISRDGQYFVYGVQNNVSGRLDSFVVQSTIGNWEVVLTEDAKLGFFSADSKQYIFQDTMGLCFLEVGTKKHRYEKHIETYKVDSKKEWLAFRLQGNDNILVLLNLITGKEKRLNEVSSYGFNRTGEWLVYQLKSNNVILKNLNMGEEVIFTKVSNYYFHPSNKWFVCQLNGAEKDMEIYNLQSSKEHRFSSIYSLQFFPTGDYLLLNSKNGLEYVNLVHEKITTIWSTNDTSSTISSFGFDGTGKQVVFVTVGGVERAIWYWAAGMDKSEIKVNSKTPGMGGDVLIQSGAVFTDNGRYIRFTLKPVIANPSMPSPDAIQVDVWSYQDKILQSTQPYLKETKTYSAILYLETGKVIMPEKGYEKLGGIIGDHGLIIKSGSSVFGDRFWEKGYYLDSTWLFSLQNGTRRLLPTKTSYNNIWFSPDGKHCIYFDAEKQCNYFSYELATGKLVNISAKVPAWQLGLTQFNLRTAEKPSHGSGIKLWLDGGKGFFVFDNYDIWQLDARGKIPPVNITNGYGRSHNISFNLLNFSGNNESFIGKDTLLLSAFNTKTKVHGFYRKVMGLNGDPELLSMGLYYMQGLRDGFNGVYPLKAGGTDTWIVNRQSATEAPNYYMTRDFKTFNQLTNQQPHKKYNWLTAELHSFKQLDGTLSAGVLYKPENFNPAQKYPLIISFYGNLSEQLYHYPTADFIDAPEIFSNPAWMVSHGYLVFIPDIYFTKGQWGPSTVNTVDGAAKYLSQLPYVDGQHMGAAGHSNSGRLGFYLLTHSNSFAAMSVGSGTTNAINFSLSLIGAKQESNLEWGEVSAYGTGLGNLWQNKKSWLDQTSVLSADKVVSPLLQFHCKKDGVPIEQAIQMFIALRRLEKKAWWLQYDNGAHRLDGNDAKDWTIRYTQFFDHYLKGAPPPRWMTQGVPYNLKGIESRYELDLEGKCGNSCSICKAKNWLLKVNK
jgi:dipeptidyl aminopeptidase/acylaminoacyl peptidase